MFENFRSVLRNASKRLRKTVTIFTVKFQYFVNKFWVWFQEKVFILNVFALLAYCIHCSIKSLLTQAHTWWHLRPSTVACNFCNFLVSLSPTAPSSFKGQPLSSAASSPLLSFPASAYLTLLVSGGLATSASFLRRISCFLMSWPADVLVPLAALLSVFALTELLWFLDSPSGFYLGVSDLRRLNKYPCHTFLFEKHIKLNWIGLSHSIPMKMSSCQVEVEAKRPFHWLPSCLRWKS